MMNTGSFAAQAKANPTRYYRRPGQVVRDRRLNSAEKLAILETWELKARELAASGDESAGGEPTLLEEVMQARLELSDQPAHAGGPVSPAERKPKG